MIDPKIIAYSARQIVKLITSDPDTSPELKRVIGEMMGADLKTLKHQVIDLTEQWPVGPPCLMDEISCDYVTVVDSTGRTRHLIFL
jgi:hypothetical protein